MSQLAGMDEARQRFGVEVQKGNAGIHPWRHVAQRCGAFFARRRAAAPRPAALLTSSCPCFLSYPQICKADFVIALQYLQGLQGVGRDRLRQQAARVMKQCDLPSSEQSDSALAAKVTRNKLKRAVMVLDMLK